MFNKNFYPTPEAAIKELLEGITPRDLIGKSILEPSAGKGDIVEYILEAMHLEYPYQRQKEAALKNISTMEIEPELVAILREKGFKVIGDDFLTDPMRYRFDYIFMNPPFDKGAKHLLRAWEGLHCGTIRCLLNAETYNNPYSQERKHLKAIVDAHGSVRSIGQAFKRAERSTDVEVIVVELVKVSQEKLNLDIDLEEQEDQSIPNDWSERSELAINDQMKARALHFEQDIKAYKELLTARMKYHRLTDYAAYKRAVKNGEYNKNLNDHIAEQTAIWWTNLLKESKFAQLLTKGVRDEFFGKQFPQQKTVAFTYKNIINLLSLLMNNKGTIFNNCILDTFDLLTQYYKENRVHAEGWKTNDAYKVKMKFILPRVLAPVSENFGRYHFEYFNSHVLNDLDLVLCYLSGRSIYAFSGGESKITKTSDALKSLFDELNAGTTTSNTAESTFFKMKVFKKGTIHFTFKDELLWQFFNCKASELRGFPLPESNKVYEKQEKSRGLLALN